jgi:hypothetical protein
MQTIKHKGLEAEFTFYSGERATRNCPGEDPYVEVDGVEISDWDEFAEYFGINGETPIFAYSREAMLDRIEEREHSAIVDAAYDAMADNEPDPDDYGDPYDDFHNRDFPDYDDGPSCVGGDYWRNDAGEWCCG